MGIAEVLAFDALCVGWHAVAQATQHSVPQGDALYVLRQEVRRSAWGVTSLLQGTTLGLCRLL